MTEDLTQKTLIGLAEIYNKSLTMAKIFDDADNDLARREQRSISLQVRIELDRRDAEARANAENLEALRRINKDRLSDIGLLMGVVGNLRCELAALHHKREADAAAARASARELEELKQERLELYQQRGEYVSEVKAQIEKQWAWFRDALATHEDVGNKLLYARDQELHGLHMKIKELEAAYPVKWAIDLRATVVAEYARVKHIGGMGDGPAPDPEEMVRRMRVVMLATENLLEKLAREREETKEQVSGLSQSRDAYARIAQELIFRLGDVKKANAKEVARLRELVVYASGPGWVPVKDGEELCATDEFFSPLRMRWEKSMATDGKVHAGMPPVRRRSADFPHRTTDRSESATYKVFADSAAPNTDKQVFLMCNTPPSVLHIVDEIISEPCSPCFFNQNAMCVHEKTSSHDPAECRARPADACGPAGKLWAVKRSKEEPPKCEDYVFFSKGLRVCRNDKVPCYAEWERENAQGACGPEGKLFEPKNKPVAMPAPPDAARNEYAGEADEAPEPKAPPKRSGYVWCINDREGFICDNPKGECWRTSNERTQADSVCGPDGKLFKACEPEDK